MKRLFLDMDGTLAAWQTATFEELNEPHFFAKRPTNGNVVAAMDMFHQMIAREDIEVYILSAVIPKESIINDKNAWLDNFCPFIKKESRLFVPGEMSKAQYVQERLGTITEEDFLLDDYSKNIREWASDGGIPIKLFNGINGRSGSFYGEYTCAWLHPKQIVADIVRIMELPAFDIESIQ